MVRERLGALSTDRLSAERAGRLRSDNPERTLLLDLVIGMKVDLPEGFKPNELGPPSRLRDAHTDVAPVVNKMFGSVMANRLAFVPPFDLAKEHVPNLHLSKAHWCSGAPVG